MVTGGVAPGQGKMSRRAGIRRGREGALEQVMVAASWWLMSEWWDGIPGEVVGKARVEGIQGGCRQA